MAEPLMTPEQRLAALEQLEARQRHSQKRAVWAAWGSLAVAAVMLTILIGFATYRLADVQRQVSRLTDETKKLNGDIATKKEELNRVSADLSHKQELLASVSLKLGTNNVDDAKKELATSEAAASSKIIPRVFVHVRSKDQISLSKQIAEMLRAKGYSVPRAEILVDKGPPQTEVRYFHGDEDKEATAIALDLAKQMNLTDAKAKSIRGFETSPLVKPRQFEIWLGPGTMTAASKQ